MRYESERTKNSQQSKNLDKRKIDPLKEGIH